MRKEVASLPIFERAANAYMYTTVDAFQDVAAVMQFLTTTRTERCALVKITLHFSHEGNKQANQLSCEEQSACYFLENLRSLVRKTDKVLLLNTLMYFVLPDANLQGARIVQERLWEALVWRVHNMEAKVLPPLRISSSYCACPEPCSDFEQCIMASEITNLEFELEDTFEKERAREDELPELARRLGIPYLTLLPRNLPLEIRSLVSPELALELHCCPLGRERDRLTVAVADPQNTQVFERLRRETGLHIFPVLAHPQELQMALDQFI